MFVFFLNPFFDSFKLQIYTYYSCPNFGEYYRYSINDSSLQIIILVKEKSSWRELFNQQISPFEQKINNIKKIVTLKDLNNDSIDDLLIMKSSDDIHPREIYYAWINYKKSFQKLTNFELMSNPEFDTKSNLFYSYYSNGCSDMSMTYKTYKLQNDSIKIVQTISCDCCLSDKCNITIDSNSVIKVKKNKAYKFVPRYFSDELRLKLKN